jgi:hypothetical protein
MADETEVNSQIADAVSQVNETVLGSSEALTRAMADQVMAQAIGLAMQNAVAQQQQLYILRNAVTTAAARSILDSNPEEALRFASEALNSDDIAQTLERLSALVKNSPAGKPQEGK